MGKLENPGMDEFEGLDLRNLWIDEAWLRVRSQWDQSTWLYARSDECYKVFLHLIMYQFPKFIYDKFAIFKIFVPRQIKCAFKLLSSVGPNSTESLVVATKMGWTLRLRNDNTTPSYPDEPDRFELVRYYLNKNQQ